MTYAKATPTEVLMRVVVENHGPDEATLDVLPTLWFRNTWSWAEGAPRPRIERDGTSLQVGEHALAGYRLDAAPGPDGLAPEALFCENDTNLPRVFGAPPSTLYPKDGINDHVVSGAATVNPGRLRHQGRAPVPGHRPGRRHGRAAAAAAPPGCRPAPPEPDWAATAFDDVVAAREADADEFYAALAPAGTTAEEQRVLRQASAGLVWSKQIYPYDVGRWLDGDPGQPPPAGSRRGVRNDAWRHLDSFDVLAMPDPWEYPWFAAWDLAFHAVAWAHLDPAFAKYQTLVLLREWFQHPNGALPAYEWNFDDVNPPIHVLAALRVYRIDGSRDREFLERVFQKLVVNFTWWLNREDEDGNNVFGGGFLGLDNISPVDRSKLPDGFRLEQADGTAWMAYYAMSMLVIAVELAQENPVYDDMVVKFLEQFLQIRRALEDQGLYDTEDAFFYDRLVHPSGESMPVQVRTIAGLVPLLPAVGLPRPQATHVDRLGKGFAQGPRELGPAGRHPRRPGARARRPAEHPRLGAAPRRRAAGPEGVPRRGRLPVAARPALGVEALRGPPVLHPRDAGRDDRLRAGGVDHRDVRRQLQLARPGVDAAELPRGAPVRHLAAVPRRRLHPRVPHRLGRTAHLRRDRPGPRRPAGVDLAPGRERPPPGLRRGAPAAGGPGLEGQPALLRVLPR